MFGNQCYHYIKLSHLQISFVIYFMKPTIIAGTRPTIEPHFIHHCSLCAYVSPKWYAPPNGQTLFGVASVFLFGLICLTSVFPSFLSSSSIEYSTIDQHH